MSGDNGDTGHPARKVSREELKQYLADKQREVPALTTRSIASNFSEVESSTVRKNLQDLVGEKELCRFNDGDRTIWWYPREEDEAGDIPYTEFVDESIDYSAIKPHEVPRNFAEEVVEEKLPHYQSQSLWSKLSSSTQLALIASLGLIVLGLGELAVGTLGLQRSTAVLLFQSGVIAALLTSFVFVGLTLLNILSDYGYITRDPLSER